MSTDLPAEVRAEAIEAAKSALWSRAEESAPRVVKAVVAVVAAEIERQLKADGELAARAERATRQELARTGLAAIAERDALQARITELEETLERAESCYVEARAVVELQQREKAALRAQLDQSQRIYAEFVTGQHEGALARVELLTAALTGFVMSYEEMGLDESPETAELIKKARAALAAGETESEA